MSNDRHYEVLASLRALGRTSSEESVRLEEHLGQCASCRQAYSEFENILDETLSPKGRERRFIGRFVDLFSRRNRYKRRFAAKAAEHGIHFSDEAAGAEVALRDAVLPWLGQYYKFALAVLLLLGAIGLFGYRLSESQIQNAAMANENVQLGSTIEELRQQIAALSETKSFMEAALSESRGAHSLALNRASELEEHSDGLSTEINSLQATLNLAGHREEKLQTQLHEAERVVAQATAEMQGLRTNRRADAAAKAAQQARINELTNDLKAQRETLNRTGRLLAADRDIRDLMGARSLHIIDVFDVDDRGRTRRPFGRVFYTENKSLVFYAFDLAGGKITPANYSFQAWGYREPAARSAQSLGIFYVDDEKQKRWVLQFDDPEVLRHIDAVFVTVEPFGGGSKPTGRKLLYAYLKNKPNHP